MEESQRRDQAGGSMEESGRRNHGGGTMASRRHLRGIWGHLGGIWEASQNGSSAEAPRSLPRGTQEAPRRGTQGAARRHPGGPSDRPSDRVTWGGTCLNILMDVCSRLHFFAKSNLFS